MPHLSESQLQQAQRNLQAFAWLFLVDGDHLNIPSHSLKKYEAREPGYCNASLHAWVQAFRQPLNGKLQPDFFLKLHRDMLAFLSPETAGCWKQNSSHFMLNLTEKYKWVNGVVYKNPGINCSKDGFKQILNNYFIDTAKPCHRLYFKSMHNPPLDDFHLFHIPVGNSLQLGIHKGRPKNDILVSCESTDLVDLSHKIYHSGFEAKLFEMLEDPQYWCYFLAIDKAQLLIRGDRTAVSTVAGNTALALFNEYNKELETQDLTPQQKISIIVKLIQPIDQYHLTTDGNIRSCYGLLNYLLHQYQLPLTLLNNPNCLDGYSNDQVVTEILTGQQRFIDLVLNNKLPFYHQAVSPHIIPQGIPGVSLELLNEFINEVCIANIVQVLKQKSLEQQALKQKLFLPTKLLFDISSSSSVQGSRQVYQALETAPRLIFNKALYWNSRQQHQFTDNKNSTQELIAAADELLSTKKISLVF